jgi:hypothetical protein
MCKCTWPLHRSWSVVCVLGGRSLGNYCTATSLVVAASSTCHHSLSTMRILPLTEKNARRGFPTTELPLPVLRNTQKVKSTLPYTWKDLVIRDTIFVEENNFGISYLPCRFLYKTPLPDDHPPSPNQATKPGRDSYVSALYNYEQSCCHYCHYCQYC